MGTRGIHYVNVEFCYWFDCLSLHTVVMSTIFNIVIFGIRILWAYLVLSGFVLIHPAYVVQARDSTTKHRGSDLSNLEDLTEYEYQAHIGQEASCDSGPRSSLS